MCEERSLIAVGSAGTWFINVDESDDDYCLQLSGLRIDLQLELFELKDLLGVYAYLKHGAHNKATKKETGVVLGYAGLYPVYIIHDEEFDSRWYIKLRRDFREMYDAQLCLTIDRTDVILLTEAFGQILEDLEMSTDG